MMQASLPAGSAAHSILSNKETHSTLVRWLQNHVLWLERVWGKGLGARFGLVECVGVLRKNEDSRRGWWRGATVLRFFCDRGIVLRIWDGRGKRYIRTGRPGVKLLTGSSHSTNVDKLGSDTLPPLWTDVRTRPSILQPLYWKCQPRDFTSRSGRLNPLT